MANAVSRFQNSSSILALLLIGFLSGGIALIEPRQSWKTIAVAAIVAGVVGVWRCVGMHANAPKSAMIPSAIASAVLYGLAFGVGCIVVVLFGPEPMQFVVGAAMAISVAPLFWLNDNPGQGMIFGLAAFGVVVITVSRPFLRSIRNRSE